MGFLRKRQTSLQEKTAVGMGVWVACGKGERAWSIVTLTVVPLCIDPVELTAVRMALASALKVMFVGVS